MEIEHLGRSITLGEVRNDVIPGLYRSVDLGHPDWDETGTVRPRRWVAGSAGWPAVRDRISDPAALAELTRARDHLPPAPTIEKLTAEAVFERVRERLVSEAPSRLECVFVALDVYAATDFATQGGPPVSFDSATGLPLAGSMQVPVTTGGQPWIATDMRMFSTHARAGTDEASVAEQLRLLERQAELYWSGTHGPQPLIEILVAQVDVLGLAPPSDPDLGSA